MCGCAGHCHQFTCAWRCEYVIEERTFILHGHDGVLLSFTTRDDHKAHPTPAPATLARLHTASPTAHVNAL